VTGRLVFSTSRDDATRVFYSPDKDQVFAVATDGSIYVVNSEDGTFENTLLGIQGYNDVSSYDPDEGLLALASAPGDIKVWNLIDQVELITLPGSGSQAIALAFSPDNSLLAIGYDLGIVLIWDWRNQIVKAVPVLPDNQSGAVDQLLFSPDGQYLIGTAGDAGLVWSVSDGALLHTLPVGVGGSNYLFKTSTTGPFIITGGTAADATLWNILDGKLASALPDMGGNNLDGVFSPDGNLLFTSLYTDEVVLWNLANLANGSIARSNQPIENSNILNLIWTDDGFLVLLIDARGPIEVWGIP
jgi:WD40 repeat protein